jgi:hypothetical protein
MTATPRMYDKTTVARALVKRDLRVERGGESQESSEGEKGGERQKSGEKERRGERQECRREESRVMRCEITVPVGGGVVSLTPTMKERPREAFARVGADVYRGASSAGQDKGVAQDRLRCAAPAAALAVSVEWGHAVPEQGVGKAKWAGDTAWSTTAAHQEDAGPGDDDVHSDAGGDGDGGGNAGEGRRSTTRAVTDAVGVWQGLLVPAVVGADGGRRGRAVPVLRDDAAKSRGHAGPVQWGDAGEWRGHAAPVPVDDVTKWSGCSTRAAAEVVVVLFVGALTGVWVGWGLVGVAQCCHRQLWQCEGAYEAAIRFSKPAPTSFPSFPASSMASSCSTCCRCSGVSRRCGVAVLAFFSVILCFWRWLFTLLGGG